MQLTVGKFMTANGSESSIGEVLRHLGVVEYRTLHDACRKDDFITGWVVICLFSFSLLAMVRGCRNRTKYDNMSSKDSLKTKNHSYIYSGHGHSPFIAVCRFT
jgi:hypothetical protein